MRKCLLIIIGCFFVLNVFGQYNYYRFGVGGGLGLNTAFADLDKKVPGQTIIGTVDYHFTPFFSGGIELQKGILSGGDKVNDPHERYFKNSYSAFSINSKVQLGQFINFESSNFLYAIRGLYGGLGVGLINNNNTDIIRVKKDGYKFPGEDKSSGIFIPINAGMNVNILDRWGYTRFIINVNYQLSVTTGEGLDGYNDASKGGAFSKIPDMYGMFSAGIKVCFGPEGLY